MPQQSDDPPRSSPQSESAGTAERDPGGPGEGAREREGGVSDFVRRAVAAGVEAAGRSKDDFVRIATTEIRGWLDRLELDTELRKTLSKLVLEVKAEIRFRPAEDGTLEPETRADIKTRSTTRG